MGGRAKSSPKDYKHRKTTSHSATASTCSRRTQIARLSRLMLSTVRVLVSSIPQFKRKPRNQRSLLGPFACGLKSDCAKGSPPLTKTVRVIQLDLRLIW